MFIKDGFAYFEDGTVIEDDRCKEDKVLVPYFGRMIEMCGRPTGCNVCTARTFENWFRSQAELKTQSLV